MSGDNQYRCPRCSGLRDAIRQSVLTQMPPFLHLALMRFSYDMNTGERVKVKVPVSYPQHLTVAGVDYDLHGVIYHKGGSVCLPLRPAGLFKLIPARLIMDTSSAMYTTRGERPS